ncbi:autotransporter outer membrane beta-barrel domain-containing protein [Terricaulis silvestris]|uniref:Autotransporter domain-containing protein n=1 Tax=Terricaulis silvestris TaxID=2686094 RepID=A0A6I6MKR8_9CAUL|nr:autotransporter outer membrane beta-barrel domain-containing protein [Terricaulis silvestris]QGZ95850.1 hypothetical protein DSM104635_02703 [Terricaulis silvestris]
MRISKVHLAGLMAALAGGAATNAQADDLTVSTARTDPVFTATAQNGTPGDVTVTSAGSIAIEDGEAAITVNSSNADADSEFVQVQGTISAVDEDNVIGILLGNGFTGNISSIGNITFTEDYTPADLAGDTDTEADEPFAEGINRFGILQDAGDTYTGDITSGGSVSIEGNNSGGIALRGTLIGDLTTSGNIVVVGDNSHGIVLGNNGAGGVTGDVALRGSVSARGDGASAVIVDGVISGFLRLNNTYASTGFRSTSPPADTSVLDPDDLLSGGAALAINRSVTGGVYVEGLGFADDPDDDGDGIDDLGDDADTDDDLTAAIRSFGAAPAVDINAAAGVSIVLGAVTGPGAPAGGYGFVNRGTISGIGAYEDFSATGLRLQAIFGSSSVDTSAGIFNDGLITATAFSNADAYGLFVGEGVTVPTLHNQNSISAISSGELAFDAYAIYIDENASLAAIDNSSTIRSQFVGELGNATAIYDGSDTLTTINNSGTISGIAFVVAADETATGFSRAIDLSASTQDVTITQTANADEDVIAIITGDVLLGDGNDTISLLAGTGTGTWSFGNGADTFLLNGDASFAGVLDDLDSTLDLDVLGESILRLNEGTNLQATTVDFGADVTFVPVLAAGDPALIVADTITFAGDINNHASILPAIPAGLLEDTHVFMTATTSMNNGDLVTGLVTGEGTPFVYNIEVSLTNPAANSGDPNSLQATYSLKTPVQLGLTDNETTAFDPIVEALRTDLDASAALTSLDSADEFFDAYEDLMPSFSSAATEVSATAIQQMQSATANRLAATRLHDLNDTSVWAQEIGYSLTRTPPTSNGQEYSGNGFGVAAGIDGPLENGALFGLSASFIASEVEEEGRPDSEIAISIGQFNAYFGAGVGPLDLDVILGAGVGKFSSQRNVEIGSTFAALSEADWWTYEGHGSIRLSAPMQVSNWMIMTPQAQLTYAYLTEEGYTEEGGGTAIDYEVDDANSQRLWGDAGVEFSGRLRLGGENSYIAPRLFAGYRTNLIDEEAERTFRFVSAPGNEFTLTDEALGDGGPLVGIGIDATNGFSTFTLGYEGEFGDQIERHSVNASIRFRF